METRAFPLKLKSVSTDGTFLGYGSTYGNLDLVGDIVQPGAFAQSIQSQGKGYPLLWVHDQETPLGIAKISDSQTGLVVNGQLLMSDPNAVRVHGHLQMGSVRGLSIGFASPDPAQTSYDENGTRILRSIRLFELSLCPVPANPLAIVTSVKSARRSFAEMAHFMQDIRSKAAPLDDETRAHVQTIYEHALSMLGYPDDDPDDQDDDQDQDDPFDEDAAKALLLQLKSLAAA
jgi:uncharacterized protein